MQIGIMTRVFIRPSLEQVAEAVQACGLAAVQLNLTSASLPALPSELDEEAAAQIGDVFRAQGIEVAAVSANFNAIHPDLAARAEGVRRVGLLASRCRTLGARIITMCTGTRDPENMWRYHPGNAAPEAWTDLVEITRRLLDFAEEYDLTLAFEPEVVNVIDSAAKAQRLLEQIGSPRLGVLLDPANLVQPEHLPHTREVLEDAFARLKRHIVMAHAKDVIAPQVGESDCRRVAAGAGVLDYRYYLQALAAAGFGGALILHDLAESEIERCHSMLETLLAAVTC